MCVVSGELFQKKMRKESSVHCFFVDRFYRSWLCSFEVAQRLLCRKPSCFGAPDMTHVNLTIEFI